MRREAVAKFHCCRSTSSAIAIRSLCCATSKIVPLPISSLSFLKQVSLRNVLLRPRNNNQVLSLGDKTFCTAWLQEGQNDTGYFFDFFMGSNCALSQCRNMDQQI